MLFASLLCKRGASLHPLNPGRQTKPMGQGGSMHGTALEGSFHTLHFDEVCIWNPEARHKSCMQCKKLIHIYCKWKTHDFATSLLTLISCAWVSLSLSLSLLDLTTHLPLKQGKKLKIHSATLVVAMPAEANFAPYKV